MSSPHRPLHTVQLRVLLAVLVNLGSILFSPVRAQSLRKLERRAINRSHLTFVNGDTVQRFTLSDARPRPRPGRFYYWRGPDRIVRAAGAYDGRLLTDDYRLTNRAGTLLVSGRFRDGLKTGLWQTWRDDGTLLSQSRWQGGRLRGRVWQYDVAGRRIRPVGAVAPASPSAPHLWQPQYWQQAWQARQRRRAVRPAAVPAPVVGSPVVTPASPAVAPAASAPPAPVPAVKKAKKQKGKTPRNSPSVVAPTPAPQPR